MIHVEYRYAPNYSPSYQHSISSQNYQGLIQFLWHLHCQFSILLALKRCFKSIDFPFHNHEKKNSTALHRVCHRKLWLFTLSFPAFETSCLWFQMDSCLQSVFNGSSRLLVTETSTEQEPQPIKLSDLGV